MSASRRVAAAEPVVATAPHIARSSCSGRQTSGQLLRAWVHASASSDCQVASSRSAIAVHSLNVRPAGAKGRPWPSAMSWVTRWWGSLTMRSPVRWSQVAKKFPSTRRHGNFMSVPMAVPDLVRNGSAMSQKNAVAGVGAVRSIVASAPPGPERELLEQGEGEGTVAVDVEAAGGLGVGQGEAGVEEVGEGDRVGADGCVGLLGRRGAGLE